MKKSNYTLEISQEMMDAYGKRVMEAINEHHIKQSEHKPVATSTREEMDQLFLEAIPEDPTEAFKVLDFILENVMTKSTIVSHPKAYSFVPGPSNFIGAMGDALASGFNIFSGGWAASPAAATCRAHRAT